MKKIQATLFLLGLIVHAMAQITFTATVNKNALTTNDRLQLNFTLDNGTSTQNFKAPTLYDFYILGGPSQSSSFSSINGKTSQSISFLYVLQPKAAGTFTIGSASITVGGKTYTTQPITIQVSDKPTANTNQNQTNTNTQSDGSTENLNDYLKDNFFIKTEISDVEIYKGESITVTHKLYIKRNSQIVDYALKGATKVPKFDGFYAQDIDLAQQQLSYETIDGMQYAVQTIKKTICTAQQAGYLEIDPMIVEAVVRIKSQKKNRSSGDPFDDFFNNFPDPFSNSYQDTPCSISSPAVKIKVNDLPLGAPADFNGAVGKFTMNTELNATTTKTDEPLTYRIVINGDGNLNLFEAPQLNLPPGWETYDPKITEGKNSKTYEYLLIPRSPGKFNIPAHTWSYFDPSKKQYVSLASDAYAVQVAAGENYTGSSNMQGVNKEDVELLNKDIRFIKKDDPDYINDANNTTGSALFYTSIGLPIILGIGIFISTARRKELLKDVVALKNKRATAVAKKRLAKAANYVKTADAKQFYDETIRALWGYLSDKFNIPGSELSKENIESYLSKHQVNTDTAESVLKLLNECELALFAPQLASLSLEASYKNAIHLIAKLEEEIKS